MITSKYEVYQLAKKVQLNSAYGALGWSNEYFRFYDIRQAEAVTLSGQLVIRWVQKDLNAYFNKILKTESEDYIIAADTDSVYLKLDKIVQSAFKDKDVSKEKIVEFLARYCDQYLQKEITKSYENLAEYLNAFQQKMRMKRELIGDRGIWTAKKRYIINYYDKEGVRFTKPKLKIMGIEAIKSSTPAFCREKIKGAIKVILSSKETDLHNYIKTVEKEFNKLPAEEIASPRTCNGMDKYFDRQNTFKSGTPIHVRGSLIYNKMLKDKKLLKKYQAIQEGEKVKFFYLKEPNPAQSHVLSITDILPKELEMEKYIDYDIQFDKTFKEPLRMILDVIGWKTEKQNNLFAFLGDE